jgi:hypothetical protein
MTSRTVLAGRIEFDNAALKKDLDVLSTVPIIKEQYDEFSSGTWINHSLYNRTGEWRDTQYTDYDHPAIKTELGEKTPYISKIIEKTFDVEHMRMARVRNLIKGQVIPHIDFLELSEKKDGYIRILIPLETCLDSYHTEEKFGVFRMRKGDIWILESTVPHGAHNLGSDNRRILSLDFQYTDENSPHYSRIFKDKKAHDERYRPAMVARSQLEPEDLNDYLSMLAENFKSRDDAERILVKLSELQLRFDSPVSDIYNNLVSVAKLTNDSDLIDHCEKMRKFYIGSRVLNERFPLRQGLIEA